MDDKYLDLMATELTEAKILSLPQRDGSQRSLDQKALYASRRMETFFGCFRKDDAYNPEVYVAAAVGLLVTYSDGVITAVTDPVSGLPSRSKFLPALAEIKDACEAEAKKQAEAERYKRWDERMYKGDRREVLPPSNEPNLFISEGFRHYDAMMEKHKKTNGEYSRVDRRKCEFDGVIRLGIWVPLGWLDDVNKVSA